MKVPNDLYSELNTRMDELRSIYLKEYELFKNTLLNAGYTEINGSTGAYNDSAAVYIHLHIDKAYINGQYDNSRPIEASVSCLDNNELEKVVMVIRNHALVNVKRRIASIQNIVKEIKAL